MFYICGRRPQKFFWSWKSTELKNIIDKSEDTNVHDPDATHNTWNIETWPLRKAEESRIKLFERRILRKIYGPCFDINIGEWRKRHNKELEELFQRPNIANEIKKRRLTLAGHAWRRVGSIVRTIIEETPRKTTLTLERLCETRKALNQRYHGE
jgi:hypothetical protein